ncbi:MAG: aldolase [Candidatus Omnitrophica bacterium CG23_combo_of_CG06-09_8_20_14_all_41_10]|uniref:Aldolase n=1 Tax=Candidatus Sherwoodlollariibacterium unditelluris TaxID=1974757 RepID=A0A2G9YJ54_9BACT|nr:MAG: aldolase [Candidatus Omnitrophica bacterium CG23_combo_of_CG06-09_8_20_14_all_41_10]
MGRKPLDINKIVTDLVLTDDSSLKKKLAKKITDMAYKKGIYPSSIHELYLGFGRGEISEFTVPAINLRSMTYDLSRAIFRVGLKTNSGAFIFEIAKSEMGYTAQSPLEYVAVILAAAIREGYSGPVFIQGDHFQANAKKYKENPEKEIEALQAIISESITAGFYNIDIDSSTLVDLSKPEIKKQQKDNYEVCAKLTQFIRRIEPKGITVSVGGEIGEVGHQNSTPEDLRAFMEGYKERLRKGLTGISKISIQTGTSHGGVVKVDGSIAEVKLDFNTLKMLSGIAQKEYGLGGAVQHGASTLPEEMFHKFPENNTLEVHLATGFQNMMFDSKSFPVYLKNKMYEWLKLNVASERKEGESDEQFFYKARKKALGPFKKEIIGLSQDVRDTITAEIEQKFDFLFKQLNAVNNKSLVDKYISLKRVIGRKRKNAAGGVHDGEGAD